MELEASAMIGLFWDTRRFIWEEHESVDTLKMTLHIKFPFTTFLFWLFLFFVLFLSFSSLLALYLEQ